MVPLQGKTTQVAWANRFNYSKDGAIGMVEAIVGEAVPGPGVVTDDRHFEPGLSWAELGKSIRFVTCFLSKEPQLELIRRD